MTPIDYFKLQAKNLIRDYKTQRPLYDENGRLVYYEYSPTYYDIDRIFNECDFDEDNFSLMKAQHFFAYMVGFNSWSELINASKSEIELAKLCWDNQDKIGLDDWYSYISMAEEMNNCFFEAEERIEIFKQVFVEQDGHHNPFGDYRIKK